MTVFYAHFVFLDTEKTDGSWNFQPRDWNSNLSTLCLVEIQNAWEKGIWRDFRVFLQFYARHSLFQPRFRNEIRHPARGFVILGNTTRITWWDQRSCVWFNFSYEYFSFFFESLEHNIKGTVSYKKFNSILSTYSFTLKQPSDPIVSPFVTIHPFANKSMDKLIPN